MLEKYHKLQPKLKTTNELKLALQTIELPTKTHQQGGGELHQTLDCMAVAAIGGHFKHLQ